MSTTEVFVVTNNADDGEGSLRQALLEAAALPADHIKVVKVQSSVGPVTGPIPRNTIIAGQTDPGDVS